MQKEDNYDCWLTLMFFLCMLTIFSVFTFTIPLTYSVIPRPPTLDQIRCANIYGYTNFDPISNHKSDIRNFYTDKFNCYEHLNTTYQKQIVIDNFSTFDGYFVIILNGGWEKYLHRPDFFKE